MAASIDSLNPKMQIQIIDNQRASKENNELRCSLTDMTGTNLTTPAVILKTPDIVPKASFLNKTETRSGLANY